MKWIGLFFVISGLSLTIGQAVVFGPQLPEKVASHFDADGNADGWMSRNGFLIFSVALQFGMTAFLLLMAVGMRFLPTSMINIPNRDYWLDDVRRESTLRINRDMLILVTGLTTLFLVAMFQMTINVNLNAGGRLGGGWFWPVFAGYLVLVTCCVGWMVGRFFRVPADT